MSELNLQKPQRQDWLSQPLTAVMTLDWEKTIYAIFLIIAIVSRFWGLGDRVVSHDESLHTQYSYQYYNGDGYTHTPLMHGPFLFHATSLSYWLFGHNDFTARIPVAVFGVVMVLMPYFLRDWIGRKGALFASFILLISPYTTYYSRYIRHDVYAIVWALIIVIATFYYLRDRQEKYLWWFAGGLALLFATKEISFIYVAVFGSALIVQLLAQVLGQPWFKKEWPKLYRPLAIVVLGILVLGVGVGGKYLAERGMEEAAAAESQPSAVDPAGDDVIEGDGSVDFAVYRWTQIAGILIACAGLFMIGHALKGRLLEYAEFDLIILYTTLLLPSVVALLVSIVGWNPLDYNLNQCSLAGQEAMGFMQLFFARLGSGECWSILLSSGIIRTSLFLVPVAGVSIAIGFWWDSRRWVVTAVIFHVIFALFYTSFFTNPAGWTSGTIGSLGYWLEQQEVQRGSQPNFYYAVVVPLYEFLPVIFSLLAFRWWTIRKNIYALTSFWIRTAVAAWLGFGLANWWYLERFDHLGIEETNTPGLTAIAAVFVVAIGYWVVFGASRAKGAARVARWSDTFSVESLLEPFPFFVWWLLLTIAGYTIAGEKMPWLSIHFVIPMAFMVGWYFNDKLSETTVAEFFSTKSLMLLGLSTLFIVSIFLALGPAFTGQVAFGELQAAGQSSVGRFLGSLLVAGGIAYLMNQVSEGVDSRVRNYGWLFGSFILLSLLTIRFTYMASFPNADYTTEYLVYAHGAPATKGDIMPQLEELSLRMHGDMSLNVAYDNESSWPYTWYLRTFPNRTYFAANPTPSVTEADAILVGDANWSKIEPYVGDDYDVQEFTYLWWPMEDYRQISWGTIIGDLDTPAGERNNLANPAVRQGLWNIFFYRDYESFGEVVGKNYEIGAWPLRRQMRLYIKREAKAMLWDYGVGATLITLPEDPYAERELPFVPEMVMGAGELLKPRNIAVHADGRLFVADSGNHRIAVFGADGTFQYAFGEFGSAVGQFSEPWGIAVDDEYVYVADTWNHRVQKLTLDGTFVTVFGQSGTVEDTSTGEGLFFGPRAITLLPNNQMAITDTGNHRIQVYDRDGSFVHMIGRLGALAGEFYEPVGVASSANGRVYVADTWNERIQELILDPAPFAIGEQDVSAWDASQSIENKPYMSVDQEGRLYVTDPEGYRVLIFDSELNYLGRFGNYAVDMSGFSLPNGVATDLENNVYVVDSGHGVIMKFDSPFE